MDSAHDAKEIHECGRRLGHAPIIDGNPRDKKAERQRENTARRWVIPVERMRYRVRSTVERACRRLTD